MSSGSPRSSISTLKPLARALGSASGFEQDIREAPASTSIITGEKLRARYVLIPDDRTSAFRTVERQLRLLQRSGCVVQRCAKAHIFP